MLKKIKINSIFYIYLKKKLKNIYYNNKIIKKLNFKNNINFFFFINTNNFYKYTKDINLNFFNNKYLKNIYNLSIKEKNINCLDCLPNKVKNVLLKETHSLSFKQFGIKYFNEVAFLFVTNIFLKNTKNICIFIKKKLDNTHFKQHRIFFFFFLIFLLHILNPFLKN